MCRPYPHNSFNRRQGFTLLELALVLVIIALLVGGILAGQSIIRNAALKSIVTDLSKFKGAIAQFKNQYKALPGDMADAQDYWGIQDANAASCITSASTDQKTCNGDSDNQIDLSAGSNEPLRLWQHLVNAGFLDGFYTGARDGTTNTSATPKNVPQGKIAKALWYIEYVGTLSADPTRFDASYGDAMLYGALVTNAAPTGGVLKPEEAWSIDTKLDDGLPGQGKIMAGNYTNCTNATDSTTIATNYKLTASALACTLYFTNMLADR